MVVESSCDIAGVISAVSGMSNLQKLVVCLFGISLHRVNFYSVFVSCFLLERYEK